MNEWTEVRLGELAPFKYGKALREENRKTGNFNVYSSAGICGLSNEYLASKGIVVGRKGTAGSVFYSATPFFCIDTAFYIDVVSCNCDMKFLYYYMQLMNLGSFNNDAAVPGLNRNLAHKLKVRTPPLHAQTRIAKILSAYDDAIENNNRRIALLEKAARELYREWFVRFRFPGYKKAKFVNGLPEGWKIGKVSDVVQLQRGHDLPLTSVNKGIFPVVGSGGIIAYHNKSTINAPVIVLGRSGSIGVPQFHNYACWVHNTAIYAKNIYAKPYWAYHVLCQIDYSLLMGGSAVPTLNRNHVEAQKIVIPSCEIQGKFDYFVKDFMAKKTNLQQQSQNLARQRDLLLPRLMSGKLEV